MSKNLVPKDMGNGSTQPNKTQLALKPLKCDLSLKVVCYFSPLLTHALIKLKPKDCNSPSKHATNAKDAEMQKLQEYIKQIKKML